MPIIKKPITIFAAQEFAPGGQLPTEIELLQTGDWQAPWKGHIVNTVEAFNQMVANFNAGAGKFQPDNKLPINLDHQKIEAAGWIHGLEVRGNSLWGTGVEWTPLGKQKLADKEFAYFSSEWSPVWQNDLDEEDFVDNVFTGGALTNYPLFPANKPLVADKKTTKGLTASGKSIKLYMKGSVMNLAELLAKEVSELTAEEKAFIVSNKADLTAEQTTTLTEAGVLEAEAVEETEAEKTAREAQDATDAAAAATAADTAAAEAEANKNKGMTQISASKLKELEANAAQGVEAANKLRAIEASTATERMIISASNKEGRFLQASHSTLTKFYLSLNASQQKDFTGIIASLPKMPLGVVAGKSEQGSANSAADQLVAKAEKLVADKKAPDFQTAMKQVTASNKELVAQAGEDE